MNLDRRQRGVALLIALLAVALAVILIASLLDRGELAFARTRNALRATQAAAYADGLEAYAAQVLMRDLDEGALDTHSDIWAMPLPPQDVPGGRMSAHLRELNGCFNLNNLVSPMPGEAAQWQQRLRNLLTALELDPALGGAIVDWLDSDGNIDADAGAEDAAYLAQPVAYRAANRVFAHVSELRLVRGISGEAWQRLTAHVCALPPGSRLNLNTATTAVLMSLDSRITATLAERIRQDGQARWSDVDAALRELEQQGIRITSRIGLGVVSQYFLARGELVLDGVPFTFGSVLERTQGSADGGVRVLMRTRGAEDAGQPAAVSGFSAVRAAAR